MLTGVLLRLVLPGHRLNVWVVLGCVRPPCPLSATLISPLGLRTPAPGLRATGGGIGDWREVGMIPVSTGGDCPLFLL